MRLDTFRGQVRYIFTTQQFAGSSKKLTFLSTNYFVTFPGQNRNFQLQRNS